MPLNPYDLSQKSIDFVEENPEFVSIIVDLIKDFHAKGAETVSVGELLLSMGYAPEEISDESFENGFVINDEIVKSLDQSEILAKILGKIN